MSQIVTICLFEVRRLLKNRRTLLVMIVMPIVFALVFGGLAGGKSNRMKLAVVDQDHSMTAQYVIDHLKKSSMMEITVDQNEHAQTLLKDQKLAGIILIPAGLENQLGNEQSARLSFQHGPNLSASAAIEQEIQNSLSQASVMMQAAQSYVQRNPSSDVGKTYKQLITAKNNESIQVYTSQVTKDRTTKQLTGMGSTSIGFGILFMMSTLISVTGVFHEARQTGIWYRMLSTPVTRVQILVGYLLSFVVTGWIQFGILIGVTKVLFGLQWGNIVGVVVLVTAMILAIVGLGLFLAGFVKTLEQQNALGTLIVVSTCMLGGVFWPLDIVPNLMRKIGEAVPQYWAMQGFTELLARGGTLADILLPISVLMGFAVVFLTVGIARVRYE